MVNSPVAGEKKEAFLVRLDRQGRLIVPASLRHALGLGPGDRLVLRREGDRLVLERLEAVEEAIWREMAGVEGDLAAELIADRRREAERDG